MSQWAAAAALRWPLDVGVRQGGADVVRGPARPAPPGREADPHREAGLGEAQRQAPPLGPRPTDQPDGQLTARHARPPLGRPNCGPFRPCGEYKGAGAPSSAAGAPPHHRPARALPWTHPPQPSRPTREGASWPLRQQAPAPPSAPADAALQLRGVCGSTTGSCARSTASISRWGAASSSSWWGRAGAARRRCCASRRASAPDAGRGAGAGRIGRRGAGRQAAGARRADGRRCSPGATCGPTSRCRSRSTGRRTDPRRPTPNR